MYHRTRNETSVAERMIDMLLTSDDTKLISANRYYLPINDDTFEIRHFYTPMILRDHQTIIVNDRYYSPSTRKFQSQLTWALSQHELIGEFEVIHIETDVGRDGGLQWYDLVDIAQMLQDDKWADLWITRHTRCWVNVKITEDGCFPKP